MDRRQRVPVRRRADSPRCLLWSLVSRAPAYLWRLRRLAVVEREEVWVSGPRRVVGAHVDLGDDPDAADAADEHILPRAPIEGRIAAAEAIVRTAEHRVSCCRRRALD